jgi:hypothetical protein
MADSDFATEGQLNALVTALATQAEKSPIYVYHGATGSTARPSFGGTVIWVGSATPANADTSKDFWIDTT